MRLPRLRALRPIAVTLALLSCTENGPVGPNLDVNGARLLVGGASTTVVISQVYGGGGNTGTPAATLKNDFIEIFNRGTSAVSVAGWSVQYASNTGSFNNKTDLTGTLQPGQYMLIQEAAGTAGTTALPTPDASGTINMSGTAGKVALVTNNTLLSCGATGTSPAPCSAAKIATITDLVGYGSGTTWFEGTNPTGTLNNVNAAIRKTGGCTDADDNASDFAVSLAGPRNSATTFAPCGVVANPVDHVTIDPTSTSIAYKGTQNYTAHAFDASNADITATNPISWTSSSATIATVASTGANPATAVATAKYVGDVTITAAAGGKTASATLHINAPPPPPTVHFSELHYDNSGTDVNEAIEVEGPPGTDLTGWSVVLYGGDSSVNAMYSTTDLGVTLPTTCTGKGVIVINYATGGIRNAKFNGTGAPAGLALVDNNDQVVEFLSYEGTFTAIDGPAAGIASTDMGVSEDPAPAPGNSLKRDQYGIWQAPSAADFGACNGSGAIIPPTTNTITFSGRLATDPALPVGFEDQLFATEKNSSGVTVTGATFTWSSDTPGIATIDAAGVMHAVSAGTATFRATANDGTVATYSLQTVSNTFSNTADWSGNLEFGIPTGHVQAGDLLITHNQFTSSFNKTRNIPNWVSAKIDASHYGIGADRCDCFTYDPLVADSGGVRYTTDVYTGEGSVWNRGHLLRSADVESSAGDNSIAYLFTNIAPQSADMNQGPWAVEENFLGDLAKTGGKDVYVIIGTSGVSSAEAHLVKADVTIPAYFWKVAVIVPHGRKLADIHDYSDLQIISVIMPNINGIKNVSWTTYKTTVDAVEALSGYDLLNALPDDIEPVVESNDQIPTAVMSGPDAGVEGASLSFSGNGSSDPDAGDVLTYSWDFGDNTTATGINPSHVFADNGQYIVTLTVRDQIGAKNVTTKVVTISNAAPSGVFASPAPVSEGSSFNLSIDNVTDAGSADVAAGFSYRFDCGTGFGGWTSSSSTSCVAGDNPGSAVAAEVKDKDGATAHYDGSVAISNVAPTAVFTDNGPVNEGSSFTLRLDGASDVPADVAAGLQYRFDCGTGPGAWQSSATATCAAPNHGTYNVSGEVKDKDGGESIYSSAVTVNNVAPTAVLVYTSSVNEGSPISLELNNGTDSPADVAAGLQYRFDCGAGFGSWGAATSISCPTNDNGTPTVGGQIRDQEGAVSSYSAVATVNNVAPTGAFATTAPVNEGSSFTLSINGGSDVSSADLAAGLEYRFDCGNGFGSWGASSSIVCPAADNPGLQSAGEIRDKDGAVTSFTGFSAVNNVAPQVVVDAASPITSGTTYSLSGGFADAGQNDGPWSYVINWGDGNSAGSTNVQGAIAGSHQYFVAGTYTVTLTVKDKDGAVGSKSITLQVNPVAGTMDATQSQITTSNSGNGIVKVTVLGNSSFSASSIVLSTVRIGSVHPAREGNGAYKVQIADVNRDGIADMVAQFVRGDLDAVGALNGSTLTLNATLTDGRQIQSTASVSVK